MGRNTESGIRSTESRIPCTEYNGALGPVGVQTPTLRYVNIESKGIIMDAKTKISQSTGVGIVKPPPDVTIPSVPPGFVPSNTKDYRGFRPKSSELAVVPDVVLELQRFDDYDSVFGRTAPPVSDVSQALEASAQWTAQLADSSDWIGYVKSQEGMTWKDTLVLVDKLKAPFELAGAHDPTLLSRYPALARLLGAAKVIAKRGAATKTRKAHAKANLAALATRPNATGPAVAPAAGAVSQGA